MKNLKNIILLLFILAASLTSCKHDDAKPALKSYLNVSKNYDSKGNLIVSRNYSYNNDLLSSINSSVNSKTIIENFTYDGSGNELTYSNGTLTISYEYLNSKLSKSTKTYTSNGNKTTALYAYNGDNVTISLTGVDENGSDATSILNLIYTNGDLTNNNGELINYNTSIKNPLPIQVSEFIKLSKSEITKDSGGLYTYELNSDGLVTKKTNSVSNTSITYEYVKK